RLCGLIGVLFLASCYDLDEINENPNGISPETAHPNLLLTTVMTEAGKSIVDLGYGDIAGVMQHTQKDSWSSGHNDYDWDEKDWNNYFNMLRNNNLAYQRAIDLGLEFHQGVCLVMKSFIFGLLTDLWGEAPYTAALKGDQGEDNLYPIFDTQENIYMGILDDLKTANDLLSKDRSAYSEIYADGDVFLHGDPAKWRKFANSLMLRYYMRLSEKMPSLAQSGVEMIVNNPSQFPIISSNDDDVTMTYVGSSSDDAWPNNQEFDPSGSGFRRIKIAATLSERLQALGDARLGVWAAKVEIPIKISDKYAPELDVVVDGVRYLLPEGLAANNQVVKAPEYLTADALRQYAVIDTNSTYVGLPQSIGSEPYWYNLNPNPVQGGSNPHVSYLADIYREASGPLLKSRIISFAEVSFIQAEAAIRGWNTGDAQTHYENAVRASLETWGVGDTYDDYITHPEVAFDNTIKQVIEQKWIASWTAAAEAWFDYRRTGYPELEAGPLARRSKLPLRFYYGNNEKNINSDNYDAAIQNLEVTNFSREDNEDSPWSKMWLLQGTGKPW
ncbi:MAG: SusD/RagB family nutrient-binding outer membrane lipoprotein, partial [Saprospiraceae bacterium]|nr:SusD/RagB family nutrient-binding outer membrane lipoprotein [Saprospiraceae bacterium]